MKLGLSSELSVIRYKQFSAFKQWQAPLIFFRLLDLQLHVISKTDTNLGVIVKGGINSGGKQGRPMVFIFSNSTNMTVVPDRLEPFGS